MKGSRRLGGEKKKIVVKLNGSENSIGVVVRGKCEVIGTSSKGSGLQAGRVAVAGESLQVLQKIPGSTAVSALSPGCR